MEKYETFDYIKCHTKEMRDLILETLENTGLAVIVSDQNDGQFFYKL